MFSGGKVPPAWLPRAPDAKPLSRGYARLRGENPARPAGKACLCRRGRSVQILDVVDAQPFGGVHQGDGGVVGAVVVGVGHLYHIGVSLLAGQLGGLGLTTGQVGLVYGTIGILGLTIGGIIGGIVAAKGGLRRWLWPMAWSISLTCATFVYLSYYQPDSLFIINLCVFIEQFGYGFGFTAYMLYLIYFSDGEHKTAHYAICTAFMALGMMLPGMAAGWLQELIGYKHFFYWVMICCAATIAVCAFIKIDPNYGKKDANENETVTK